MSRRARGDRHPPFYALLTVTDQSQERDGILIGPYEPLDKMKVHMDWVYGGVPKGFGKELFESDVERIADNLVLAIGVNVTSDKADPTVHFSETDHFFVC